MEAIRRRVEIVPAAVGVALLIGAIAARQSFLDRHFLPSFFIPRPWYVLIESTVRAVIAAAGAMCIVGRSWIARLLTRSPVIVGQVMLAAALALGASEVTLRAIHLRPTEWLVADEEPKRQPDMRLGWVLAPSRTGRTIVGGRPIEYATDADGYRVRSAGEPVDRERPAIVFIGESVIFGEGLNWDESIPAQTAALAGVQTANLAVHGYSTDQMFLRLQQELPRFRHPLAVVSIFMTELFGRNLDDDRPHLSPGLIWEPPVPASRLMALAGLLVPYRRNRTLNDGVRMTQEVLRATVALARAHGAMPLIVVPQFGVEDGAARALRERVLEPDFPVLVVPLDPEWRLPWDRHPNAHAARSIAQAIAAGLPLRQPAHDSSNTPGRRAGSTVVAFMSHRRSGAISIPRRLTDAVRPSPTTRIAPLALEVARDTSHSPSGV